MRMKFRITCREFGFRCRRAAIHVIRFRSQSILYAVIAFSGSFLLLFSVLQFSCAQALRQMTNLPYMEYYLYYSSDKSDPAPEYDKTTVFYGDHALSVLQMFEVVEDVFATTQYTAKTNLSYITTRGTFSGKPGTLLWTVIPNTQYDDSFRLGERILTAGRHLSMEDYRAERQFALLDEALAKENKLHVGSRFDLSDGISYEVAGLFRTVKAEKMPENDADIPQNLILASAPPPNGEKSSIGTRDVYFRFRNEVSAQDRAAFLDYLGGLGIIGEDRFDRYGFIAVKDLNAMNQAGIRTVFRIAFLSLFCVFIIITTAVRLFLRMVLQSRRREVLLYQAMGEKRRYVWLTLFLECVYVQIPASLLGLISCLLLSKDSLRALFAHFSRKMSPENLRATSSVFLETEQRVGTLLTEFTALENLPRVLIGIFSVLLCVVGVSLTIQLRQLLCSRTITLLSEQKQ